MFEIKKIWVAGHSRPNIFALNKKNVVKIDQLENNYLVEFSSGKHLLIREDCVYMRELDFIKPNKDILIETEEAQPSSKAFYVMHTHQTVEKIH